MSTVNSLMTDLANAIRGKAGISGKLSITAMINAVNGISVDTNPDIDFNGVTVTADKMLSGIVAINSDGEKVTGTIPTVTLSKSGNTVSIQQGYTNGGSVIVDIPDDTATVKVSANTVTITAGVIEAQTVTIPLAQITETAESVTIGVGYVGQEKTYNLSSGGSSAEFGYITADGSIQLYDFNVTPPVKKGTPITADIVTVLPRPYEGDIVEGEYLRFTAVEDSTVAVHGTAGICFDLACRKNSGVWNEAPSGTAIMLSAGEYVEFYGNYSGTVFFDIDLEEVKTDTSNTINYKPFLFFETSGKLRCSGYLNSVSAFSNTLTTGIYSLLLAGCEGVISSPIIPKMTAVYDGKTDEFPFEFMMGAPSMDEITVEFTNWNGAENIKWLGVAETGTFRKPAALPTIFGETDEDGICTYIPQGWTVVDI